MYGTSQNAFEVLSNEDGMSSDLEITVTGEDAIEVETENFGFVALNGDTKVKLFPDTFPESSIPISSASLFTIANKRKLFAAAGPSTFILGETESLRKTFITAPSGSTIVNYSPTHSLPLPTPISHIVFNSSEGFLILGASSGGLAIYSVDSLWKGQKDSLFEVGTDGLALQEIRPNPNPEFARLIAILTQNGGVRILDLERRAFAPGKQDVLLRTGVSTITWSQKGKQIICGLTNGSCVQITPEGIQQAEIPKPPGLIDHFVSHLTWLENNLFIIALTPIQSNPQEPNNDTVFYVFTRNSAKENFRFQKLPDPTPPFGMSSRQAYHFCTEIKHWGPHLQDALIFANTSSVDIGLITRFSTAIQDVPAGTFTTTMIANDSRRAALPLDEQGVNDTSPIGVVLDLSNQSKVLRPIAGEELEETGPLPIIMVLNNESLVTAWHIVYSDAVRKNVGYTQLIALKENPPTETAQSDQASLPSAFPALSSPFPALSGSIKPFNAPATGAPSPAFAAPAFGGRPAFGQPSFGRPAFGQAAFGQTGWGTAASAAPISSTFGSNTNSGFGKFAGAGGFAAMANAAAGTSPSWAINGPRSSTASTSPFGGLQSASSNAPSFGGLVGSGSSSTFGSSPSPFKITSTFQADNTTSMSGPSDTKGGLFGSFGPSLEDALGGGKISSADADMDTETPRIATPVDKEEDMDSSSSHPPSPPSFATELLREHAPILSPVSTNPPSAPLPQSPVANQPESEDAKLAPTTDAPLPPDWMPKKEKEKTPDAPLPPIPGNELNERKPSAKAATGTGEILQGIFDSKASSIGAFKSVEAPEKPTTGPFGSGASPFSTGLSDKPASQLKQTQANESQAQIEKSALTSPPVHAPSSEPTAGLFSTRLPPSPSILPLKSAFTTTQQSPPQGSDGLSNSTSATTQKDAKSGGSVFDSPIPDMGGGLFSKSSKKKPVKPEKGDLAKDKPIMVSRVSPSATKSILGKKTEVARAKSTPMSPIHRFGPLGKTRQALKPSPLSRRQQESEEEDEEYEDEGEDDDIDGELEETDVEEIEEEDVSIGRSGGMKGGRVKEVTQQEPKSIPKRLPSTHSPRAATPAVPTSVPQHSRVTTPTVPIAPRAPEPEPEDERVRKLLNSAIPVEPNPNPPEFVLTDKIVEASPEDQFEGIYDKAYESCNVMVNTIGSLARNLEAYVSAHNQCPDLNKHTKYRPLQQLKEVDEWRLCEIVHIKALLEDEAQSKTLMGWNGVTGLQDMLDNLSKGFLKLQNKRTELKLVEEFLKNPQAAGHSRYLPPDQTLQQREIRNKLALIQNQLTEAEKRITQLKASLVARDRGKPGVTVNNPPTVEAVQNTISKLTGMVEKKNSDVEYLSELLRRLKEKRKLGETSLYGQSTYMKITPAKGKGKDTSGNEQVFTGESLALTSRARWNLHNDELEMEEAREEISLRKEKGGKLRKAMILAGARITRIA